MAWNLTQARVNLTAIHWTSQTYKIISGSDSFRFILRCLSILNLVLELLSSIIQCSSHCCTYIKCCELITLHEHQKRALADSLGRKHSSFSTLQLLMNFRFSFQLPLSVLKLPRRETHVGLSFGAKSAVPPPPKVVSSLKLIALTLSRSGQLWDRSPHVSTGHGMRLMCAQGTLITKDGKIHLSHFLGDLQVNTRVPGWRDGAPGRVCLHTSMDRDSGWQALSPGCLWLSVLCLTSGLDLINNSVWCHTESLSLPGIRSAKAGLYSHAERIFHTGAHLNNCNW